MPRRDLTDIVVVMDRSGSMSFRQSDAEGGLNTFITEQQRLPGEATFSLVQFDTEYEWVHRGVAIKSVPRCALVPRGGTALLDAVGRAIVETGERLNAIPEDQRPGAVVFVILTDGEENSSREFSREKVKELISHQTDKYQWQFTFLGAGVDAFAEARAIGISLQSAVNISPTRSRESYAIASANVSRIRAANSTGGVLSAANKYTDEERLTVTVDVDKKTARR